MKRWLVIHYCPWDKICREYDAPTRVNVRLGRRFFYFNPLDWKDRGGWRL